MINTLALTKKSELLKNEPVERLLSDDIEWYWIDMQDADDGEIKILGEQFRFNSLAIEDCLGRTERPKVDFFDGYNFFIVHALNHKTLKPIEVDVFAGENYVVTFHKAKLDEIEHVHRKITENPRLVKGGIYLVYMLFDSIVDEYFPLVYKIEDELSVIDIRWGDKRIHNLIDKVFQIRSDLIKLRHTINSMKELLYRILNSDHMGLYRDQKKYFNDIYDHLLKLSDIVETNRELSSDIRENYLSINTHKMNKIMTFLTMISAIFIPLTFIVGIYGMNFDYMPELRWPYGYYIIMGVMGLIVILMILLFKRKGWFNIKK